ncbi:acyl-CoA dehydrogenase family protein [Auritidibacter ignavus]|uniref:acyl-CoA dehydrogenase family protein n=1 Tax=Auritidibacter ignavus TaxID=678932 RepID=UPI002FE682A9
MANTVLDKYLPPVDLPEDLLDEVREHATAVDSGDSLARAVLPRLGAAGLIGLGAPNNRDGSLPSQVAVIAHLAGISLSVAFGLWGHRMSIEYLSLAGTDFAQRQLAELLEGTKPGISGMASAFRAFAGAGPVDLEAQHTEGGFRISGTVPWASNLYDDALLVTAARVEADGDLIVIAFPLTAPGVRVGKDLDLLALKGTASTYVTVEDVFLPEEQVLSHEFREFMGTCRPSFGLLQSSFCLGLAQASLDNAQARLDKGLNNMFATDIRQAAERLDQLTQTVADYAERIGTDRAPDRRAVLAARLEAGQTAVELASLEIKTAGGKGYVTTSDANRRYREAAFLPVQSPSEAQLRWELEQGH